MKYKKSRLLLFLLFCCYFTEAHAVFLPADTTTKQAQSSTFYNASGLGFAEHSLIFDDHLLFFKNNFGIGARARFATRKYWRTIYADPYTSFSEYRFNNELAALLAYRALNKNPFQLVLSAGPLRRMEKAREWRNAGAGGEPLIGALMDRNKHDDAVRYGITASAEFIYRQAGDKAGASLFVFGSYTKDYLIGGISLNLVLGK